MYDGIPYQVKQRAGDRGITAEDMEKSQHTDFNADTTNESASVGTGVARECVGCGPHRAALDSGGKRAKIVFKNSRENSDCIISYVRAIKTKHYSCSAYLSSASWAITLTYTLKTGSPVSKT